MWKTIQEEPNYEVSRVGEVRNRKTKHIKSLRLDRYGYLRVTLYPSAKTYSVHRLVAKAFLRGEELETVNHKNGDKEDNSVENLEWASFSDNTRHAHETGLIALDVNGVKNPMAKFTQKDLDNITRLSNSGLTVRHIADELGFPYERVRRFVRGESYKN